jgi:hypothetical protein
MVMTTDVQNFELLARQLADDAWREAAREAEAHGNQASKDDLEAAVAEAISKAIAAGRLPQDYIEAAYAAQLAERTDARITSYGHRMLDKVGAGQMPLGDLLDDGVYLRTTDSQRIRFGAIDLTAILAVQRNEYTNVRRQQDSYNAKLDRVFDLMIPVLQQGGTVDEHADAIRQL